MRIFQIAQADCVDPYCVDSTQVYTRPSQFPNGLEEDSVVDVVMPERSFKGTIVYKRGLPAGMVAVKPDTESGFVVVPATSCTVNKAWAKRHQELHDRQVHDDEIRSNEFGQGIPASMHPYPNG